MIQRAELPRPVREIEPLWIPLSDGARLAARVWLPADAETDPVPALLEYIPYRKGDFTRGRDEPIHGYFAGHGYAAVRVDLRGTGDSDGLLHDEYTRQEHEDAIEVIAWLAARPWCTGAVGMMGISWGGFNALQVAAHAPPALRAIITLCSTDDRYTDDAHYMGGCLLNENLTWGAVLTTFNALPPDPAVVGTRWRSLWKERLRNARLFPAVWLEHQARDDYWRHGSVNEDYGAIECPVYAIGGWADGYSNAVPRLLQGLAVPRKGLIGPWSHAFPHDARPGPAIGFLQEALRWWDHWLKGVDTGIMDEPMLRVWMQESVPPSPDYEERPGRWVAEPGWPPAERPLEWPLDASDTTPGAPERSDNGPEPEPMDGSAGGAGGAAGGAGEPVRVLTLSSPQTAGLGGGDWCAFGADGEMPTDQREDDGGSLTFDTAPLRERLELLGAPVVELALESDRPVALVAVRLNDVAPGGASTRVTYGLLNLTHRDGHDRPVPLEPGRRYRVRVRLNDIAHAFPPGHRLRVAVSTAYWPIAWPAPEPATLRLAPAGSRLFLPARTPRPEDAALAPFPPPEVARSESHNVIRPTRFQRTIERDLGTNETVYTILSDGGDFEGAAVAHLPGIGLEVGYTGMRRYRIGRRDPGTARAEVEQRALLRREGWEIRVEVDTAMTATADTFIVTGELRAYHDRARIFQRRWEETIPRLGI